MRVDDLLEGARDAIMPAASTESRSSVTESPSCRPLRYAAAAEEAETLRTMAAEASDSLPAPSGRG
jgi:hypothetical protein